MQVHEVLALLGSGVVAALEAAAAVVIAIAGARALYSFLSHFLHRIAMPEGEREGFARGLLLGLDFTIGSDVLKIALQPTWNGVIIAGLVVLVRTVLTLVLEYELRRHAKRDEDRANAPAATRGTTRHAGG